MKCHHCHNRGHIATCYPSCTLALEQESNDLQEFENQDPIKYLQSHWNSLLHTKCRSQMAATSSVFCKFVLNILDYCIYDKSHSNSALLPLFSDNLMSNLQSNISLPSSISISCLAVWLATKSWHQTPSKTLISPTGKNCNTMIEYFRIMNIEMNPHKSRYGHQISWALSLVYFFLIDSVFQHRLVLNFMLSFYIQ